MSAERKASLSAALLDGSENGATDRLRELNRHEESFGIQVILAGLVDDTN